MPHQPDPQNKELLFTLDVPQVIAAKCLRRMRGGTQPALVECSDGKLYVIKMMDNPRGMGTLVNELVGNMLGAALGFSVPPCSFVQSGGAFLSATPALSFTVARRSSPLQAGMQYGTRFVGEASGVHAAIEYVPSQLQRSINNRSEFLGMYLFDVWANHHDRRQALFVREGHEEATRAIFIDNCSLFGGATWSFQDERQQRPYRAQDRLNVTWDSDAASHWIERFCRVIPPVLQKAMAIVPSEWCTGSLSGLESILTGRLDKLEELCADYVRMLKQPL